MNTDKPFRERPHYKLPGELHDMCGVPIYPGDLLRTLHFRDRRRRKWYLYHTAVFTKGHMRAVPTCHLDESIRISPDGRGGDYLMDEKTASIVEVILGHGPGDCLDFTERKRIKPTPGIAAGVSD